jgi:hypothetical protein
MAALEKSADVSNYNTVLEPGFPSPRDFIVALGIFTMISISLKPFIPAQTFNG